MGKPVIAGVVPILCLMFLIPRQSAALSFSSNKCYRSTSDSFSCCSFYCCLLIHAHSPPPPPIPLLPSLSVSRLKLIWRHFTAMATTPPSHISFANPHQPNSPPPPPPDCTTIPPRPTASLPPHFKVCASGPKDAAIRAKAL
jgi:hypothetical protein